MRKGKSLGPCVRDEREEVKKKRDKEEWKRRAKRRVRARHEEKIARKK